jgi:hypothetical protein
VWCCVVRCGWKAFRNRNPEHPSGRCCVRDERGSSSQGRGLPLQLQSSSKLQSTVRNVLYFSFLRWRMLIREEERHMLTYSTLSRSNLISHNRVVLRTEDQHKPKVLGAPTADPTWQAMKPCDAQKDLTSHAGVCAGRGMGRKPAIPPSVLYLRTFSDSRRVVT